MVEDGLHARTKGILTAGFHDDRWLLVQKSVRTAYTLRTLNAAGTEDNARTR